MAYLHPTATATAKNATVGGLVSGQNMIAVVSCSSGSIPTFTPRVYQGAASYIADAGYGDGPEFCTRYFKGSKSEFNPNGLPLYFCRTPVTTAGTVSDFNPSGITGNSAVTATGTPNERIDTFTFKVVVGGTIGTDGIQFQYSMGRDFSATQRLGTATSWAIPNLGVTLNFAAGTLVTGDSLTISTTGPRASNADNSTALAALLALPQKFRAVLIVGDYAEADVNTLMADAALWYAGNKRVVFFVQARDQAQPTSMVGEASETVTFAASGHTVTRNTGSFITDGFTTGMDVIVAGSTSNNGNLGHPTTVTATVLTFASGVVNETDTSSATLSITGNESMAEWVTSLLADAASFQDADGRPWWHAGRAWMPSELRPGFRVRVPAAWAVLERWMQHDVQISPNAKALGPLGAGDWSIEDDTHNVVEHDSRTTQSLEARGFGTLTSYVGEEGAFCGNPSTFGPQGSALSILPWRGVASVACDVIQIVTENFIGDSPDLNADGTLTAEELDRYTGIVTSQLSAELLTSKQEGPRASSITWTPSSTDILNVPNATMNGEAELVTLGLINTVNTTVFVNRTR